MSATNGAARTELANDLVERSSAIGASVLGGIIIHNDVLAQLPDLEVDDFFDMRHRVVFGAMRALEAASKPIDHVTLELEIERQEKLDAIGGIAFLGELALAAADVRPAGVSNLAVALRTLRVSAVQAIEVAADEQRQEYEVDELALRDTEREATPPRSRWIRQLSSFMGDEEPSDDDAEDWIIRDIIPRGEAALIVGPPKSGKTWALLDLAISVAMGVAWLGSLENTMRSPARVLVLAFEDGQRRLRKRIWELARAHGITPNDETLQRNLVVSREPLRLPDAGEQRAFAAELKAWRPALVLVDNLTRVMLGDQNAIKDAKRFADVWCQLGTDVGASMTFLHHTAKAGPLRFDKRGAGDPFELVRGSGDIVGTARNVVLMRPLEAPEKLSDVRMRGNLDLRRESFVLGFERARDESQGKWLATLADRGDGDTVRAQLVADRRAQADTAKRAEAARELERRRDMALRICRENASRARPHGKVSTRGLADALGLKSAASVSSVLEGLVSSDVLRKGDRNEGYVFVDAVFTEEDAAPPAPASEGAP